MNQKIKKMVWTALLVAVLAMGQIASGIPSAYADSPNLTAENIAGSSTVMPGKSVVLNIKLFNRGGAYSFTKAELKLVSGNESDIREISEELNQITEIGAGTSEKPKEVSLAFQIDTTGSARGGSKAFELVLTPQTGGASVAPIQVKGELFVDTAGSLPSSTAAKLTPLVEWSYKIKPAGGLAKGSDNSIVLEMRNIGNTDIRNGSCSITLPEGLSVPNGGTTQYIGRISERMTGSASFPIAVSEDIKGGTYSITGRLSGTDEAEENVSFENTFYISIEGKKVGSVKDVTIQNVSLPAAAKTGTDFTMSFSVRNEGKDTAEDLKAAVVMPEGLMNRTNATFVIDALKGGEEKTFSVTMFAKKDADGSYPIQITVNALSGENAGGAAQYASIFVTKESSGSAKTPQLMVDQYNYGGPSVMAGREFSLSLGMINTSDKNLSNIKIAIVSDDGTFVPVGSSNSFFVENVKAGEHITKELRMSSKPAAEQKTSAVTVKMSYEDEGGQAYTAEDTVSIPVMQVTRFVVDQIVPPYECFLDNPASASVQFFNMGKTTLSNLKINAEGDFDITESNSSYVGNMASGASESYSFNFIPRQLGPLEGKVIFTYENMDGIETTYEEPFLFEVTEMPVWEEPEMEEPEKKKSLPWPLIIGGIALVLIVTGIIVWRKVRKARLNKKLEIQDAAFYAAMDLDKETKAAQKAIEETSGPETAAQKAEEETTEPETAAQGEESKGKAKKTKKTGVD